MEDTEMCMHGIEMFDDCAECFHEVEKTEMVSSNLYGCISMRAFYEGQCKHGIMNTKQCMSCAEEMMMVITV